MKKIVKIKLPYLIVLTIILALASCSAAYKGFPDRVVKPEEELETLKTFITTKTTEYNELDSIYELKRRGLRNEIINARIAAIDIQFSAFQQKLRGEGINLNVGTDIITLGLGAAGGLVSGGTSQVLSATTTAVTGLKGSVDKNAFFEETMPALFAQMIAQRKKVLVRIRKGLNTSTSDYPLQQGTADLLDYKYAGSIPGSIATIVEDAGTTASKATEEINKTLAFKMDKSAASLKDFLGPISKNKTFDELKVIMIKNCWKDKKVNLPQNTPFVDFMFQDSYQDHRAKTLECIKKISN